MGTFMALSTSPQGSWPVHGQDQTDVRAAREALDACLDTGAADIVYEGFSNRPGSGCTRGVLVCATRQALSDLVAREAFTEMTLLWRQGKVR